MLNKLQKIAFVGAGNMASAIIDGLIQSGMSTDRIYASARTQARLDTIESQYAINTGTNQDICQNAEVIVLAVKPQVLKQVCEEIAPHISENALVLSVAAGIRSESIARWLNKPQLAIVRCMPNTPSAIGVGAAGLFASPHVSLEQKDLAENVMKAVGIAVYVESEKDIDSVTAVSGSGPAYFFLFIEAIIEAGTTLGLDKETASKLAIQTAKGAAELAEKSADDVTTLRQKVSSPRGTTEQAILSFQNDNLNAIVNRAMQACATRATTLADELGN